MHVMRKQSASAFDWFVNAYSSAALPSKPPLSGKSFVVHIYYTVRNRSRSRMCSDLVAN